MSLTLSLNNALSGLKTNQRSLSVLSHNIANANTDGYSRQIVDQSAIYIAGVGSGVRVDDVIRKVDKYLQRAVQTQGTEVARTTVIDDYYQRMQVLLGEPGAKNTLDEYMTGFFGSLQTLSETPDRSSSRNSTIAAATALTSSVSNLATNLQDLRFEADRDISDAVQSVNQLLRNLDALNRAITTASSVGQSTAGLQDQRDIYVRELSEFMDVQVSYDQHGAVNIITGDGVGLVDGTYHELRYSPMQSASNFITDSQLGSLSVITLDSAGNMVGRPAELISGGTTGNVKSALSGGKIEGLRLMRDEMIPAFLDQLDQLASNLRDAVNAIHNDGSGFPPPTSLTGTRGVYASQVTTWSGSVRIAALTKDGQPVPAGYANENSTGLRPLLLNLSTLNSGQGNGQPTMQTIVNEINNHFMAPTRKTQLGNINNIELVSNTNSLSLGAAATFNFDFDIENISGKNSSVFLTSITVRDSTGADITNVTKGPVGIPLASTQTYYTTAGIPDVTIEMAGAHSVQVGDMIYLGPPAGPSVNGLPASDVTGYFEVIAVAGGSITFQAHSNAGITGYVDDSTVVIQEPYDTSIHVASGGVVRTRELGNDFQVDFGMNPNSNYYDITVDVAVQDEDGNFSTSLITYRVQNGATNLINDRFQPIVTVGDAVEVLPQTTVDALRAMLVDENGNEVRKVNGEYVDHYPSYLKIYSPNGEYTVVIDEMDSMESGNPAASSPTPGTRWGFSHYFGLNDFFAPNNPVATGDTLRNSAINLRVAQRLIDNPNLITSGEMVLQKQPTAIGAAPQYTYVRYSGDNQLATRLSGLASANLNFAEAGGLPNISINLLGYTAEMLGAIAARSASASSEAQNAQTLYDGFKSRAEAISGVNLDEELANTIIFQNAYSATARIVTVVDEMFQEILQMV